MSMTLEAMATEVAKSIGGQNTATVVDIARSAIKASIRDWNAAKTWNFLLKDTADGFRVAGCNCAAASATVNAPSTGAFDGVNIGVEVTVLAGDTVTLAAGTTVSSVSRNTNGDIASITLSNAFGGTNDTSTTLIFDGDIPIREGANEYNLPTDFGSPYAVRLTVNPRLLEYIKYREWNKKIIKQDVQGSVDVYTIYNPASPLTQNYGTYRLRVFATPDAADIAHVQYFRSMDPDATTVDIPDDYLSMLIDYAIWRFVRSKNTEDTRLPELKEAARIGLSTAMTDDEENADDESVRLISQIEATNGGQQRLWTNGNFYPTMGDY